MGTLTRRRLNSIGISISSVLLVWLGVKPVRAASGFIGAPQETYPPGACSGDSGDGGDYGDGGDGGDSGDGGVPICYYGPNGNIC